MPVLAGVLDRQFRGAVAAAVAVVPEFHGIVGRILGHFGFEWGAEGDLQPVLGCVGLEGRVDRVARVADAEEPAIAGGRVLPALEAGQIELAVLGAEAPAHDAALKLEPEGHQRGLGGTANGVHAHAVQQALAVAHEQRRTLPGPPLVAGDIHLTTARVVPAHGQPRDGLVITGGNGHGAVPALELVGLAGLGIARIDANLAAIRVLEREFALGGRNHAHEGTGANQVQLRGGHPMALVVAHQHRVVGSDGHAVRGPQAGGEDFHLLAIGRHLENGALMG